MRWANSLQDEKSQRIISSILSKLDEEEVPAPGMGGAPSPPPVHVEQPVSLGSGGSSVSDLEKTLRDNNRIITKEEFTSKTPMYVITGRCCCHDSFFFWFIKFLNN
jgi:hypothetical protein